MDDETNCTKAVYWRGLCPDPICPDCNVAIPEDEIDSPVCPYCGCRLDWKVYHIVNG